MGKRLPTTPRSRVRQSLRQLSLRCRERAQALKDAKYTCERCGAKKSVANGREVKVEAHHRNSIETQKEHLAAYLILKLQQSSDEINVWEFIIDLIFEFILVPASEWECLCVGCHKEEHANVI